MGLKASRRFLGSTGAEFWDWLGLVGSELGTEIIEPTSEMAQESLLLELEVSN